METSTAQVTMHLYHACPMQKLAYMHLTCSTPHTLQSVSILSAAVPFSCVFLVSFIHSFTHSLTQSLMHSLTSSISTYRSTYQSNWSLFQILFLLAWFTWWRTLTWPTVANVKENQVTLKAFNLVCAVLHLVRSSSSFAPVQVTVCQSAVARLLSAHKFLVQAVLLQWASVLMQRVP